MKRCPAMACLLAAMLFAAAVSFAQSATPLLKNKEETMQTNEGNKAILRNLYENALNKHQLKSLDQFVAADYTGLKGVKGPTGFGAPLQQLIDAFPDVQWHVEEIIAEGEKVMIRWKLTGTHLATYNEVPATGNKVSVYGIGIFTVRNGLVVSGASYTDRLGFLQSLGVLPAAIGAPSNASQSSRPADKQ